MKSFKVALVAAVLAVPLPVLSVSASAATAHNSQAGAYGPTTNNDARTHRHFKAKPKQ